MAAYVTVTFVLVGVERGKTKTIKHYRFVNGETTVSVPRVSLAHTANYMSYYAAYLKGSPEHLADLAAQEESDGVHSLNPASVQVSDADIVQSPEHRPARQVPATGDVNSAGAGTGEASGRNVSDERNPEAAAGVGHQDAGMAGQHSESSGLNVSPLSRAITGLDPEVDTNWTEGGLPAVGALAALDPTINRKAINDAAPGWTRAKAREAAALL